MSSAEEILQSYGLKRETAVRYLDAIVRSNQTQTAEEIGMTRHTVNRYKNAFQEMTGEERAFVIFTLFYDRHRSLVG